MPPTIAEAMRHAMTQLAKIESAKLDSELLLAKALGKDRVFIKAWPQQVIDEPQWQQFQRWIKQRREWHPLAHITGEKEFWDMLLTITPHVLVPRPETEVLVTQALQHIPYDVSWQILDIGTGSGAIALALAKERPHCQIHGTDLSSQALACAQQNQNKLKLKPMQWHHCDLFPNIKLKFDMIVSNPPYVEATEPNLLTELSQEPRLALVAEENGYALLQQIITQAPHWLHPHGRLIVEHGAEQSTRVQQMLQNNFHEISTHNDYAGQPRVTHAQIKSSA